VTAPLPASALLLGNFITAIAILGPAGMLADLAAGLSVSIGLAGLLITIGGVILCFASPLMAWATSGFERRHLVAGTLLVLAVGHAASAIAPDYGSLLAVRIVMLVASAMFTPVAASTIALIVHERDRPGAIAFVFLGWSAAIAFGLPIVAFVAAEFGWRATYGLFGAAALAVAVLLWIAIPGGLRGVPLSLANWGEIARNRLMMIILVITVLWTSGQFVLFPYLGPLLMQLAGAQIRDIGVAFAVMGVMGVIGNVTATRLVKPLGAFNASAVFLAAMAVGTSIWAAGAGHLLAMDLGVALWGFGFAAFNSMQQARLVTAAPVLASATVALNTSANYVGQAAGSALGGALFTSDRLLTMGYVAAALMFLAALMLFVSRHAR
jgi:predicted MFS family arabinose efflux permease